MNRRLIALAAVVLAGQLSCSPSSTDPQYELVVSTIDGYLNDDPQIDVTQRAGIINITIDTYGTGCYKPGDQDVQIDVLDVVITPYDFAPLEACSVQELQTFVHQIEFSIGQTGTLLVRVNGRDKDTGLVETYEYHLILEAP